MQHTSYICAIFEKYAHMTYYNTHKLDTILTVVHHRAPKTNRASINMKNSCVTYFIRSLCSLKKLQESYTFHLYESRISSNHLHKRDSYAPSYEIQ